MGPERAGQKPFTKTCLVLMIKQNNMKKRSRTETSIEEIKKTKGWCCLPGSTGIGSRRATGWGPGKAGQRPLTQVGLVLGIKQNNMKKRSRTKSSIGWSCLPGSTGTGSRRATGWGPGRAGQRPFTKTCLVLANNIKKRSRTKTSIEEIKKTNGWCCLPGSTGIGSRRATG